MDIEVTKIKTKEALAQAFEIRKQVFVVEQKVAEDLEYDEFENCSTHFLAVDKENGQPVGTARWRFTSHGVKMERFAVLEAYRNGTVGSHLMKAMLEDIPYFKGHIYLHAQIQVIPFYEKFGFVTQEPMFEEANIQHKKMIYNAFYAEKKND